MCKFCIKVVAWMLDCSSLLFIKDQLSGICYTVSIKSNLMTIMNMVKVISENNSVPQKVTFALFSSAAVPCTHPRVFSYWTSGNQPCAVATFPPPVIPALPVWNLDPFICKHGNRVILWGLFISKIHWTNSPVFLGRIKTGREKWYFPVHKASCPVLWGQDP